MRFSSLKRTVIGGSACPPSMIRAFQDDYGVKVFHAWGMTEMSLLGTVGTLKARQAAPTAAASSRCRRSRAGACSASR